MASPLSNPALARALANAVATSSAVQALATRLCGRGLSVFLDGIPGDRTGIKLAYPYLLVTSGPEERPRGGPVAHTIRALLAVDASAAGPTAAAPAVDPVTGVRSLPGGEDLGALADAIDEAVAAAQLGAVPNGTARDFDLVSSWPIRGVDLTFTFEDLLAF